MGLLVSVYKFPLGDATNGGISAQVKQLCVVNCNGPFSPSSDAPPALLEEHHFGCLRIVPAYQKDGKWERVPLAWMMGGNYGATSDSRFTEACENLLGHRFYGAVAIHDRSE